MTGRKQRDKQTATARVVRWEGVGWGVTFTHADGTHDAYPVGSSREAAEAEARRLRSGRPRAITPRDVIRLMFGSLG